MTKWIQGIAVALMAATGCGGAMPGLGNAQQADSVIGADTTPEAVFLGTGYDTKTEKFTLPCISGPIVQAQGDPKAEIHMDRSVDSSHVLSSLGFDASLKAHYAMVGASVEADLAQSTTEDDYSSTFIYSADYHFGNSSLDTTKYALTQVGQTAQKTLKWDEMCGDEFVYQTTNRAQFYVVFRLDFASKEDKQEFKASTGLDISGGIASVDLMAHLKTSDSSLIKRTRVHMEAYQFGGDISQLGAVLTGAHVNQSDREDAAKAVIECDLEHLEACNHMLENAILYTDPGTSHGFAAQLASSSGSPVEYLTKPWSELGVSVVPHVLTAEIAGARTDLEQKFDRVFTAKVRVDRLLGGGFAIPDDQRTQLEKAQSDLADNIASVNLAVTACYDNLTFDPNNANKPFAGKVQDCVSAVAAVKPALPSEMLLDAGGRWVIEGKAKQLGISAPDTGSYVMVGDNVGLERSYPSGQTIYWAPGLDPHEVQGWILNLYSHMGGPTGALGFPLTDETGTQDGVGRYSDFQHGSIYWTPKLGAHEVLGAIRDKWRKMGADRSILGYPTSDQYSGVGAGYYNNFQYGAIYWSPGPGAHEVHGPTYAYWRALRAEGNPNYGYPVSDVTQSSPGEYALFEHGGVYHHPNLGTFGVTGAIYTKYEEASPPRNPEDGTNPVPRYLATRLGYPTGPIVNDRGGQQIAWFEGGAIFWSPNAGAHEIVDPLTQAWMAVNTDLGWPTADETWERLPATAAQPQGRYLEYSRTDSGMILSLYGSQHAYAVTDRVGFLAEYIKLGGWNGCLGVPTGNAFEQQWGAESKHVFAWGQYFEHGWLSNLAGKVTYKCN